MRILLTAAALMLAAPVAMPAFAQSATQDAQTGPQNKAVKGMHDNNSAVPVKGPTASPAPKPRNKSKPRATPMSPA